MDWINLKLHATGQYMLETLCSRLSYDIHQFNRLPKELRWLPGAAGAKSFKLFRFDQKAVASVCGKLDHYSGDYDPPIIALQAREHDVHIDFPNRGHLPQTITFDPAENKWRIAAGEFDPETVSGAWEISQRILRPYLFPPDAN